jgi:hypothetical protein
MEYALIEIVNTQLPGRKRGLRAKTVEICTRGSCERACVRVWVRVRARHRSERGGNLRQRHTRKLKSLASLCPAILEHSVHSVSAHNLVQGVGSFKFHASGHCLEVAIRQCFRGLDKPSCPASLKFNKTWKMMKDLSFNPRLPDSSLCPLRHSVL